jgi:predicted aspartyl protease
MRARRLVLSGRQRTLTIINDLRGNVRQTTTIARIVYSWMRPKQGFDRTKAAQLCVVYGLRAAVLLASMAMAQQAEAACQLLQVGELPVVMLGNSPMIPASMNGRAVQLLVDTGAARSFIWRSAAQELKLEIIQSDAKFYGAGGADTAGAVTVHDFGLGGATIHNVRLYATGRGSAPGNGAGVLGEDVLSHWDIEFDLSAGKIRLFVPKNCDGDQVVYWAQRYFMTKLVSAPGDSNWLQAHVMLDGHEVVAMFDTGATRSTVMSQALRQTGIQPEKSPVAAAAGYGLAGKPIDTTTAVFPTLVIGQESVQNAKLCIADLFGKDTEIRLGSNIAHSVFDNPGMVIGADFFMAHRIYVARSQGKIYFTYKGGPIFQHVEANTPAPSDEAGAADAPPQ